MKRLLLCNRFISKYVEEYGLPKSIIMLNFDKWNENRLNNFQIVMYKPHGMGHSWQILYDTNKLNPICEDDKVFVTAFLGGSDYTAQYSNTVEFINQKKIYLTLTDAINELNNNSSNF
jgi:hypothetical protein